MNSIEILLVDDHVLLRESLRAVLDHAPGMHVVAAVGDADAAVAAAASLEPDAVVMDIEMPGRDPFAAAREIRAAVPSSALVFLTAHVHDRFIERALEAGAAGFLSKRERPSALVEAIRTATSGDRVYSPEVRERMVETPTVQTRGQSLSPREQEVLRYVARGLTKREIADQMNLSIKTVEGHTDHLMKKLSIHNKVDLARYAIREGFVEA